jgi:2-phosphosulfolactate phosphatase
MVRTFLRWQDVPPAELRAHTAVVIDVLRWSSVVVTALANGASWVEAYATPDEVVARADSLTRADTPGRADLLLGGERGNLPLPGFDLGNSPLEYTEARVRGRGVITTTTNGTQGIAAALAADEVLVGAFLNLPAVLARLSVAQSEGRPVALIACGRSGAIADEDVACAGAIAMALGANVTDVTTEHAIAHWVRSGRDPVRAVTSAPHAATLVAAGFGNDVLHSARSGVYDIVPRLASARRLQASYGSPPASTPS